MRRTAIPGQRRYSSELSAPPVARGDAAPDKERVQLSAFIDALSKRAPSIVVLTLCASLVGAWIEVPASLPRTLAVIVGSLALLLFGARVRRQESLSSDETETPTWIAYELAGKGTPPGYYVLGFFGLLTIALTGFQSSYAMPAWAGLALGIVWGLANRDYRADEQDL